jgi:hypothetical protein
MNPGDQHRIAKRHLDRSAIVYVRQSDPYQVRENTGLSGFPNVKAITNHIHEGLVGAVGTIRSVRIPRALYYNVACANARLSWAGPHRGSSRMT